MNDFSPRSSTVRFEQLAEEICLRLFSYVDASDLNNLRQVNRKFNRLADDLVLWRRLYQRKFFVHPIISDSSGTLVHASDSDCTDQDGNVWRRSYKLLRNSVHIYPEEDTHDRIARTLEVNPDAIILLHPGHHVLHRPLRITSSPRILGVGVGHFDNIRSQVKLEVRLGCAELCLSSSNCFAQLSYITIGFKQIGHARAPLHVTLGAQPKLLHCNFVNTSKMGWALVISGNSTSPNVKRCIIPDGVHNGVLLLEGGGLFEENEFGQCTDVCLKMVASKAVFSSNWLRPLNKIKVSEARGVIGGVVLSSRSHILAIEDNGTCRQRQGWQHWVSWPSPTSIN